LQLTDGEKLLACLFEAVYKRARMGQSSHLSILHFSYLQVSTCGFSPFRPPR
jgi:hypothetical protein